MYVCEPQASRTCGACGPLYVKLITGYFLFGLKSGGLIIIASITNPSRVFTCNNSAAPCLYCLSASTLFSLITRTGVPLASYKRTCEGVLRSLQTSMK